MPFLTSLIGKKFAFSGTLKDNEDTRDLLKDFGCKRERALSQESDYLIIGSKPDEVDVDLAKELDVPVLNEEQFHQLFDAPEDLNPEDIEPLIIAFRANADPDDIIHLDGEQAQQFIEALEKDSCIRLPVSALPAAIRKGK
jgi:BRCA1 C Terminus (BRCT) domain